MTSIYGTYITGGGRDIYGEIPGINHADITELQDKTQNITIPPTTAGLTEFTGALTINGLPVSTGTGSLQDAYDDSAAVGTALITTSDAGGELVVERGTTGGDGDVVFACADGASNKNFNVKGTGNIENTGGVLSKLDTGESFAVTDALGTTDYFKVDQTTNVITIDNDSGAFQQFSGNVISTESLVLHKLPSSGTFKVTNFSNTFDYFKVDDSIGRITLQLTTELRNTRPDADNSHDLGSGTQRWKDFYLINTLTNNDGAVIDVGTSNTIDLQATNVLINGSNIETDISNLEDKTQNIDLAGTDGTKTQFNNKVTYGTSLQGDIENTGGGNLKVRGDGDLQLEATNGTLRLNNGLPTGLTIVDGSDFTVNTTLGSTFTGVIKPSVDGGSDLGQPALRWGKLYLDDSIDNNGGSSIDFSGGATMTISATSLLLSGVTNSLGNHIFAGTAQPSADNNSDLGTGALRWKDLYLSNNIDNNNGSVVDMSTANTIDLQATSVQINGSEVEDLVKKVNSSNYVLDTAGSALTSGTGNYLLGANAGDAITTGINNILIGANSGLILTGNSNIAVGNSSLTSQTTGSLNNVVGTSGFTNLTIGTNNVGVGHSVGGTITTTSNNVLIGSSADVDTSSIGNGIGIGSNVNVDTSRHCVIGRESGNTITSIKTGLDSDCDLGQATRKFKNLYLSDTINNNDGAIIDLSTTDTIDLQADNVLINGESLQSYSEVYFQANATVTTNPGLDTYEEVAGTGTAGSATSDWTINTVSPVSLTYTGTATRLFDFGVNVTWEIDTGTAAECRIAISKNTTIQTKTEMATKLNDTLANYPHNTPLHGFIEASTNDVFKVEVKNVDDAGDDILVSFLQFYVKQV
jgi:hypothetical protein